MGRRKVTPAQARRAGKTLSAYAGQKRRAASECAQALSEGSSSAGRKMSQSYWGRRKR